MRASVIIPCSTECQELPQFGLSFGATCSEPGLWPAPPTSASFTREIKLEYEESRNVSTNSVCHSHQSWLFKGNFNIPSLYWKDGSQGLRQILATTPGNSNGQEVWCLFLTASDFHVRCCPDPHLHHKLNSLRIFVLRSTSSKKLFKKVCIKG